MLTVSISFKQTGTHSSPTKAHVEKHFGPLLPFIPGIILKATESWKARLLEVQLVIKYCFVNQISCIMMTNMYQMHLQAFTFAFKDCKADSKLILGFLSAINEMLISVSTSL